MHSLVLTANELQEHHMVQIRNHRTPVLKHEREKDNKSRVKQKEKKK